MSFRQACMIPRRASDRVACSRVLSPTRIRAILVGDNKSRLLCFGHARVAIRPERFPRFASGAEFLRALVATLRSIAPIPLREILALAAR